MPILSNKKLFKVLRRRLDGGKIGSTVQLTLCISGGAPEKQYHAEVILKGTGYKKVSRIAQINSSLPKRESSRLTKNKINELLSNILSSIDEGLVTRQEASFVPDSLVGRVVFEVDGQTEELFYLADEEDRKIQAKPISEKLSAALDALGIGVSMDRKGGR